MTNNIDDAKIEKEIERLYKLTVYGRWLFVIICWLTLMPFGMWEMRETMALCQQYCTWAAVRIGLQFKPFGAIALAFCLAITTAVLLKQSSHILQGGLSAKEKYYLGEKVKKIRSKGTKHILYSWVCKD